MPQKLKMHAIEKLVIPMLVVSFSKGEHKEVFGTGPTGFIQTFRDLLLDSLYYEDGLKVMALLCVFP